MKKETPFLSNAFQLITMSTRFLNCWSEIKKIHTEGCAWRKHKTLTLPEETTEHIPYPSRILPHKYLLPSTDALELQGEAEWETIPAKPKVCRASRTSHPHNNATTQALGLPPKSGQGGQATSFSYSKARRSAEAQRYWAGSRANGKHHPPGHERSQAAPHGDTTGWAGKTSKLPLSQHGSAPSGNSQVDERAVHRQPPRCCALAPAL